MEEILKEKVFRFFDRLKKAKKKKKRKLMRNR